MARSTARILVALTLLGGQSGPLWAGGSPPSPAPLRALTARDLVTLNDVGPNIPIFEMKLFAVSPDGRWLAFQQRKADPDANSYRLSMHLLPLPDGKPSRTIDQGGEMIRMAQDGFGKAAFPTGIAFPITPRWSADSRWFAYLKRVDGVTQVWRAFVDGRAAEPITRGHDVEDFALTAGGAVLVIQTRPDLAAARAAIAREGVTGYHYDERSFPIATPVPFASGDIPRRFDAIDLGTGIARAATTAEAALVTPVWQVRADGVRVRTRRGELFVSRKPFPGFGLTQQLVATGATSADQACHSATCRGQLLGPWPTLDARGVVFLRREGWAQSETALYRWTPGGPAPRRLSVTRDVLNDCDMTRDGLVCLAEGATAPRHFVRIDPDNGRAQKLHDPNPRFGEFALGRVRREQWTVRGIESFGDVVLPTDYQPGRRYPLILVQYQSRGFLRGGTGDEFPIQLFANHGYVVLSHNNPTPPEPDRGRTMIGSEREGLRNFVKRQTVLNSIETAVTRLIRRGLVDPARIGITGLSEGSSSVQYAAINSRMFAAGVMSSCCWEPEQVALLGPRVAEVYGQIGWPKISDRADSFWARMSLVQSGSRFPMLFQPSDDEYLLALTGYTALRERGTPADMFIYPGEHHNKFQPAHRLAIYERNLAWFDYWLKDLPPRDAAWAPQRAAWDAYKRLRGSNRVE